MSKQMKSEKENPDSKIIRNIPYPNVYVSNFIQKDIHDISYLAFNMKRSIYRADIRRAYHIMHKNVKE